jgi:uncharacterized membrane protein HdeD (DUF308 family)
MTEQPSPTRTASRRQPAGTPQSKRRPHAASFEGNPGPMEPHRRGGHSRGPRPSPTLRNLYVFRVAFSAVWVALVNTATPSTHSGATVSILAGLLLVVYPISDAAATVVDLRTDTTGRSRLPQHVNAATSTAAAVTVAIGVSVSLATAMDIFAVWAIISGAIQLTVGAQRLRQLRGQWPMIISGAGSIFAGTTFIDWSRPPSSALHALAQYSIGGAIWYLLTALWLLRARTAAPAIVAHDS